jgi:hypothetical protein
MMKLWIVHASITPGGARTGREFIDKAVTVSQGATTHHFGEVAAM